MCDKENSIKCNCIAVNVKYPLTHTGVDNLMNVYGMYAKDIERGEREGSRSVILDIHGTLHKVTFEAYSNKKIVLPKPNEGESVTKP